jgi:hypothetical protein
MAIIGGVVMVRRLSQPQLEKLVEEELTRRNEQDEVGDYRISF